MDEDIRNKLKITFVGHSMGAMTIPMYLINRKLQNKPSYVSNCISIAPTGKNENVPFVIWVFGWLMTNILCAFTRQIYVPEFLMLLQVKCCSDIKLMPALNDFSKYCGSLVIGGLGNGKNSVGTTSVKLFFNFGIFG